MLIGHSRVSQCLVYKIGEFGADVHVATGGIIKVVAMVIKTATPFVLTEDTLVGERSEPSNRAFACTFCHGNGNHFGAQPQ